MIIRYDGESKAAYVKLLDSDVIESEEVAPGVVYDLDIEDRVRGIEFYQLDSLSKQSFSSLELPLHPQEKEILNQCLFSSWEQKSPLFTVRVEKTENGNFVSRSYEAIPQSNPPKTLKIS